MRKKIAAGNWKMNLTFNEAEHLVKGLINGEKKDDALVILGVPYVYLDKMNTLVANDKQIFISSQNVHHKEDGAYTGEISVPMLKSIHVEYAIVGHSERREYFDESNELVKQKVNILLENGMTPIFCCGESLDIRKSGNHLDYVKNQISESLFHLSDTEFQKIVIAYEPIWAIGTGETASPEQAQEMHLSIRNHIANKYGEKMSDNISILYGGSVKPNNACDLFSQPDVDGGLVGGASLDVDGFLAIINSF